MQGKGVTPMSHGDFNKSCVIPMTSKSHGTVMRFGSKFGSPLRLTKFGSSLGSHKGKGDSNESCDSIDFKESW